jgi:hypothetical protein
MTEKMLAPADIVRLTAYVRACLGTMAAAAAQVPPEMRGNFIASLAASSLSTLAAEKRFTSLRELRKEIDRLLCEGPGSAAFGDGGELVLPDGSEGPAH